MVASRLSNWRLCLAIYLFRLANALLSRTFFQPDEYYQSLELAHHIVFGYGYQTWEWKQNLVHSTGGIRSPLHAFLFVPVYWILEQFKLDHTHLLIILPKFLQAAIATTTDIATYSLARRLLSPTYAASALACSLTCFFNAYAGIRTLSNSLETALTATALAYWPWKTDEISHSWSNLIISISLITTTLIVRPSSILFWSALTLSTLKNSSGDARIDIIALFTVIGTISALICFIIDSSFYGLPTFTPINFIRENIFNNLSSFYGINSWHFYFTQAFTFVNLTLFPAVILGMSSLATPGSIYESPGQLIALKSARFTVLCTMIGLSFVKHKEFRFIQPLIPLFNCFAARIMVNNYSNYRQQNPVTQKNQVNWIERLLLSRSLGFIFRSTISLGVAFYLLRYHYQAQVSVMHFLRQIPNHQLHSIGFLMPCHSTPWQSHLHKSHLASNGTEERLWMLTCEPPLNHLQNSSLVDDRNTTETMQELNKEEKGKEEEDESRSKENNEEQGSEKYEDETDEFYKDVLNFIKTKFPDRVDEKFPAISTSYIFKKIKSKDNLIKRNFQWPSHLVIFESLWKLIPVRNLLIQKGYTILWSQYNSYWHDDPVRRSGKVMVLHWASPLN